MGGLSSCDKALQNFVRRQWQQWELDPRYQFPLARGKRIVKIILEKYEFSILYDLQGTIFECSYFFQRVLRQRLSVLDDKAIVQLAFIMSKEEASRKQLLPCIQALLPSCAPKMHPNDALTVPLLIGLIIGARGPAQTDDDDDNNPFVF